MDKPSIQNQKKEALYNKITHRVITLLESVKPEDYQSPFAALASKGQPYNPTTKKCYRGINIPMLWFEQEDKQFCSNKWASFKQWKQVGATIKKGEKGSQIVFYKKLIVDRKNSQDEQEQSTVPMLRLYTVFNANQTSRFEEPEPPPQEPPFDIGPVDFAEAFCKSTQADIRFGGGQAYYDLNGDFIRMPHMQNFIATDNATRTENFFSTLFHELVHWTAHSTRLNRVLQESINDKIGYAKEELVAELGSAFLAADFGIFQTAQPSHAIYIQHWLKLLKNDNRQIFKAAAQAAKAVDHLDSYQRDLEYELYGEP